MRSNNFKCVKEYQIELLPKKDGKGVFKKKGIELVSLDGEWHFNGYLLGGSATQYTDLVGKTFKVEWEIVARSYENKEKQEIPTNDIRIESLKPLTEAEIQQAEEKLVTASFTQRELDILKMMIGAELAKEKATDLPF